MGEDAGQASAEEAVEHEYYGDDRHRPAKITSPGLHQKNDEGKGEKLVKIKEVVDERNPLDYPHRIEHDVGHKRECRQKTDRVDES